MVPSKLQLLAVVVFLLWSKAMFDAGRFSLLRPVSREPAEAELDTLVLPSSVKEVIINVGSHRDPLLPRGNHQIVIALEASPKTACDPILKLMPVHPGLHMLPVAGGARFGFKLFNEVGWDASSSFLAPAHPKVDTSVKRRTLVTVIPLSALLRAISADVLIPFLKIDAQGWDIEVINGAGEHLRRICWVQSETQTTQESIAIYGNPENHFTVHFPLMEKLGFALDRILCHDDKQGRYPFSWPPVPRVDVLDAFCSHDFNAIFRNVRNPACVGVALPDL